MAVISAAILLPRPEIRMASFNIDMSLLPVLS